MAIDKKISRQIYDEPAALQSFLHCLAKMYGIKFKTDYARAEVEVGGDSLVVKAYHGGQPAALKAFFPYITETPRAWARNDAAANARHEFDTQTLLFQHFLSKGLESLIPQPITCVQHCVFTHEALEYPFSYLIMEWKGDWDLSSAPSETIMTTILPILHQLALFIDAIHEAGYLYLDLCPNNVRIKNQKGVSVVDYGCLQSIAAMEDEEKPLDWNTGTAGYFAPERLVPRIRQAQTFTPLIATKRSDLFSLGGIAYFLFEGEDPYDEEHESAYESGNIQSLIDESLPFELTPDCLQPVILQALHEQPEKRFASGMDFYQALRNAYVHHARAMHQKRTVVSLFSQR